MQSNYLIETEEKTAHSSFIYQISTGHIIVLWFSGDETVGDNCSIYLTYIKPESNNGLQFSPFYKIISFNGYACQNPIMIEKHTKLYIFYSRRKPEKSYSQHNSEVFRISHEFSVGEENLLNINTQWSQPERIINEPGFFTKSEIITDMDGKCFIPLYTNHNINYLCGAFHSNIDLNNTNQIFRMETLNKTDISSKYTNEEEKQRLCQPHIICDNTGYKCYYRDRWSENIFMNTSFDLHTWSEPTKINLMNNNSGICMVYIEEDKYIGIGNSKLRGYRTPITIFISTDGKYWKNIKDLDMDMTFNELNSSEFSYPYMILDNNNDLLISYTFERKKIKFVKISNKEWNEWFTETNLYYCKNVEAMIHSFLADNKQVDNIYLNLEILNNVGIIDSDIDWDDLKPQIDKLINMNVQDISNYDTLKRVVLFSNNCLKNACISLEYYGYDLVLKFKVSTLYKYQFGYVSCYFFVTKKQIEEYFIKPENLDLHIMSRYYVAYLMLDDNKILNEYF